MANSKEITAVVPVSSPWTPGFIEELLPCSQQISLLYHISYLCLAKFPKLERLLRMRALETQLLFGSSEAVMLKCVGTSQNLVTSLFPMLTHAIEKNKPTLAVKYLEKARSWIAELIQDVQKMVEKYEVHNRDVSTTTSDVITEKKETEIKKSALSQEAKEMEQTIQTLKNKMNEATTKLSDIERQIAAKNLELENHVKDAASKSQGLSIFAAIVPFIGIITKSIYDAATAPGVAEKAKALEAQIQQLSTEKISLRQQEMNLQVQTIDWNMKLAKIQIDNKSIPDPVHLGEVQRYLSKIQAILIQLTTFWKNVYSLLGTIKDQTFVNEELVDEPELKDVFLGSIQKASEVWGMFGESCGKAVHIFRVQSKDAYKFLEIDPDSLSPEVWQTEYNSVKEQLLQLKVLSERAIQES